MEIIILIILLDQKKSNFLEKYLLKRQNSLLINLYENI